MKNKYVDQITVIAEPVDKSSDLLKKYEKLEEKRIENEVIQERAIINASKNLEDINKDMKDVIHNQKTQIDLLNHQLDILKNIFNDAERSSEIEKEIIEILKKDKNSPIGKLLEKTEDFGINVLANHTTPHILDAVKAVLIKCGLML